MQRALNIELLRIVCMFSIVVSHIKERSCASYPFDLLLMPHHVDCFILISGYFLVTAKFKFERILRLLAETIFYTFAITFILFCLGKVDVYELVKSIFPIAPTKFAYWFVTKYFALLLLSPFLSKLCLSLTKRGYECLLLSLLLLTSSFFVIFPFGWMYANGVSLWWMITMFVTGGYLRLYEPKFSYWGLSALLFLVVHVFSVNFLSNIVVLHYNSLITYALAISTFMWFKNLRISDSGILAKIITFIAPNVFAVYLIHAHALVMNSYFVESFNFFVGKIPDTIYLLLFGCAVILISVLVDKIRVLLFDKLQISRNISNLGQRVDVYYEGVFTK